MVLCDTAAIAQYSIFMLSCRAVFFMLYPWPMALKITIMDRRS